MNGRAGLAAAALVAAVSGAAAWRLQRPAPAVAGGTPVPAPNPAVEMIVAGLGGFRGIIAEAVWFRADRLQDEGRYGELAQLAGWLTFLEPRTPEVWAYSAWNLAYNVSVMMPTPADRWRWVEAGIRLLRDDGLSLNPGEPALYRELAWLFLLKLGTASDTAAPYYRERWKEQTEAAKRDGGWSRLKLDPAEMDAVDREYGRQDWTGPLASALYWARKGLAIAKKGDVRFELHQILFETLIVETRSDAAFAPRALAAMEAAAREFPSPMLSKLIADFKGRWNL